jgi:hypothetical protein
MRGRIWRVVRQSSAFLLGMLWDVSTLRRIDDLGDNVGLLGGMVILGMVLLLSMRIEAGRTLSAWWGGIISLVAMAILGYQLASLSLGMVALDGLEWPKALCADGCWLPALGAEGWDDRIEAVVAGAVAMGMGLVGGMTMADPGVLSRHLKWIVVFRQFMWGNILSAYVIFYYQSADVGPAFLYVLLLLALLGVNEILPRQYRQGMFEITVYQFCAFSFLLYFLPVAGAYLPIGHPDWDPIRVVLLRPGTWTPFVIAALGSLMACTVLSVLARRGLQVVRVSGAGVVDGLREVRTTMTTRGWTWMALIAALSFLRWLEAIPPAPLALIDAKLEARHWDPAGGRCDGHVLESAGASLPIWDSFQFPEDRRTWVVLEAQVFSPRHMLVPVSIDWEYFSSPGVDGEWWNPNAWWHSVRGGRQIQVPGWEEEGFQVRSCKRVFSGGRGRRDMHRFWRVTVTTPGDQSGLEVLQLLDANIPFVAVSASELMDIVPEQDALAESGTVMALAEGMPLADKSAQDLAEYIPLNLPLTDKSARDLIEHIPFSGTSAKDIIKFLPTDLPLSGMPATELVRLLDQAGIQLTKETAPALLNLITTDEYKIGRKYFLVRPGESTIR